MYIITNSFPFLEFQYAAETSKELVTRREIIKDKYDALIKESIMSAVKLMLDKSGIG